MAVDLKLNTQKSIYKPIQVEVDKTVYTCKRLTPEVMTEHYKFEMESAAISKEGNPVKLDELVQKHLCFLFPNLKKETLRQLENDEIRRFMNHVIGKMMNRQITGAKSEIETALKNTKGSGAKDSKK